MHARTREAGTHRHSRPQRHACLVEAEQVFCDDAGIPWGAIEVVGVGSRVNGEREGRVTGKTMR
jgi:hypothetical protein